MKQYATNKVLTLCLAAMLTISCAVCAADTPTCGGKTATTVIRSSADETINLTVVHEGVTVIDLPSTSRTKRINIDFRDSGASYLCASGRFALNVTGPIKYVSSSTYYFGYKNSLPFTQRDVEFNLDGSKDPWQIDEITFKDSNKNIVINTSAGLLLESESAQSNGRITINGAKSSIGYSLGVASKGNETLEINSEGAQYISTRNVRNVLINSSMDSFINIQDSLNLTINSDSAYMDGSISAVSTRSGSKSVNIAANAELIKVYTHTGNSIVAIRGGYNKSAVIAGEGSNTITAGNGDDLILNTKLIYEPGSPLDDVIEAFVEGTPQDVLNRYVNAHFPGDDQRDNLTDTIDSKGGNDIIFGSNAGDYIKAGSGQDRVYGIGGDDKIWGGSDNDILYGESGNDEIYGDAGDDYIHGSSGNDYLRGNDGKDNLIGGLGDDFIRGDNQNDTLDGQGGTDNCYGGDGTDTLQNCEE